MAIRAICPTDRFIIRIFFSCCILQDSTVGTNRPILPA